MRQLRKTVDGIEWRGTISRDGVRWVARTGDADVVVTDGAEAFLGVQYPDRLHVVRALGDEPGYSSSDKALAAASRAIREGREGKALERAIDRAWARDRRERLVDRLFHGLEQLGQLDDRTLRSESDPLRAQSIGLRSLAAVAASLGNSLLVTPAGPGKAPALNHVETWRRDAQRRWVPQSRYLRSLQAEEVYLRIVDGREVAVWRADFKDGRWAATIDGDVVLTGPTRREVCARAVRAASRTKRTGRKAGRRAA